jgi:excisionase family DNA binding protein
MISFRIGEEDLQALLECVRKVVHEELDKLWIKQRDEKLHSHKEICEMFRISRPTLYSWIKRYRIPVKRAGGRVYYKYQDVLNAVEKCKK